MENDKIALILSGIRMHASKGNIVSVRFINKKELPPVPDSISDEISVIHLKGQSPEKLLNHLNKIEIKEYSVISINNQGYALIAPDKYSLDLFADKLKNEDYNTDSELKIITRGRLKNKIVIITGAAQGFGEGIAKELFNEGANIIVADINEDKGDEIVQELNKKISSNRALFVKTNVTQPGSVKNLVINTVFEFGGIDLLVSNAGILRAGSLDETDFETFDSVTKVNYYGYFNCVKYVSEIMKFQNHFNPGYYTDIIQINSKSGLKGSNKNFSYAGGKFGGIGLTQSFALELMPHRIKVNSICPGNFFDGPLWSDPDHGLFVQYLKTGKVPGAKNIEEVKKYYEAQVPAGRGCKVSDVIKAIYYSIDQQYETGQAIPVTGGQIMLH